MAPPPKNPQGRYPIHFRPGSQLFGDSGWGEVDTESDPGSIAPTDFQRAENVRVRGHNIVNKPGLTEKIDFSSGVSNAIMYMDAAPAANPRVRLWATARGCFGATVGTGARILHIDETEDPAVQVYGDIFADADRDINLGAFDDVLYFGDSSVLRRVLQTTPPLGISASNFIISPPTAAVLPPFTGFAIRCMLEVDGEFYIGLENLSVPASSKIVAWNGLGAPKDDLTGIRPPLAMGLHQGRLLVSFDSTAGHIRVRARGSAHPGTWTTFALAGFRGATQQNSIAEERAKTYIAGGNDKIYVFDGAALTVATTVTGADTSASLGVTALDLHQGLLHYLWNVSATLEPRIGRHDPDSTASAATEWSDSHLSIQAFQPNFVLGSSMRSMRGRLFCGGRQNWLIATARDDVKGAVRVINQTGAPAAGNDVTQLVRFP